MIVWLSALAAAQVALPVEVLEAAALDAVVEHGLTGRWSATPRVFGFAGGHRVSLRLSLDGVPVYGGDGVVSLARDGSVRRTRWSRPGAPAPVRSEIPAADALDVVDGVLGTLGTPRWRHAAHRAWWVDGEAVPVWTVDGSTAAPLATWRVHVHRTSGAVVHTERTDRSASGRVYPTNPVNSEPATVELQNLASDTRLDGRLATARSCDDWEISDDPFGVTACLALSRHAVPDAAGDYLFDPNPGSIGDPFAEVHAYHHVDAVSIWLEERFGFTLPYAPIRTIVNFPMTNAFFSDFDGDGVPDVSFGHDAASGVDFAYDADVVYHEFGHALVGELAPALPFLQADAWGIEWVSGSVNEGAADVLAMLLTGDPLVGEYAGSGLDRPAVRDLAQIRRCPDDLKGEVHADGEILGAFAWQLIQDADVGPDVVAELLYGAIPLWGPTLDWPGVAAAFADTSDDLLQEGAIDPATHAAVLEVLDASGMVDCGRAIPLTSGREVELFVPSMGLQGDLGRLPGGVQLAVEVPPDARALTITVPAFDGPDGMGWVVLGTAGEPVAHDFTEIEALGLGFATPDGSDWEAAGDGPAAFTLTPDGDPELVPGDTLYLAVASENLGTMAPFAFDFGRMSLRIEVDQPGAPVRAHGVAGCRHGPAIGAARPWWPGLGLARIRGSR